MNTYGIHHFRAGGLSDDGSGALDDNSRPYKSDWVAPGKTVRPDRHRMPVVEGPIDKKIEALLQTLKDGIGNKADVCCKIGYAYIANGEKEQGIYYLKMAHEQGFSDATDKLVELGVIDPPPPPPPPPQPLPKPNKQDLINFAMSIAESKKHGKWKDGYEM